MQCIDGRLPEHRVPIFVSLKDVSRTSKRWNFQRYITQIFIDCGVIDANFKVETLLQKGKLLLLLDGLDEVIEGEDTRRILSEITLTSDTFSGNQFVITCRIAAQEYVFPAFTDVEMADFNVEQIKNFVHNWFSSKEPRDRSENFLLKLQLNENKRIRELATNPLLLTLLCLVFEERAHFPTNRARLYKEGIDILLINLSSG